MVKRISKYGVVKVLMVITVTFLAVIGYFSFLENLEMGVNENIENKKLYVTTKEINIEYGSELSLSPKDYLKEEVDGVVCELYKIVDNTSIVEKIDDASLLEVGNYYLVFTYEDEKEEVFVQVMDTQAPIIVLKQHELVLEFGDKFDVSHYVESVWDVVDGDLEYTVEGNVNSHQVGSYVITIVAVDQHGLSTKESLKVLVKEEKKNSALSSEKENDVAVINPEDGKTDADYDPFAGVSEGVVEEKSEETEVVVPWEVEEVPVDRRGDGDLAFATKEEAIAWANQQILDENSDWYGCKYMLSQIQKYGQKRLPDDPWAVTFIPVE